MVGRWNKAFLQVIANLGIVFAAIQFTPYITPASENKFLAFIVPLSILVLAFFLLAIEDKD